VTTSADLRWWLQIAPTLQWTWAKTYATRAPHWYIVAGKTPGLSYDDFIRAGRVIRTFGEPGKFYSVTRLYLFTEDRRLQFWCGWSHPPQDSDATLINMATTERTYGPQSDFDQDRLSELRLPLDDGDDDWGR
jgi:hypothetical protein